MPEVPITMPQLGESIAEATVVALKVKPGDKVTADQEIIEVETNKAVMSVTTPCAGEIKTITAEVKGTYPVGAVLGYVEGSEKDAAKFVKNAPKPPAESVGAEVPGRDEAHSKAAAENKPNGAIGQTGGGLPVPATAKGAGYLSPRMRARMAELQLTRADLAGVLGSG
nr:2-oxo acid dehydrogenase subunit E2 [Chthoniobacterales bacterium]